MSRAPTSTPWPTASGSPSSSAAPPQPLTPPAPAAAHPPFSSTWGAFNLAQPRSQPSNLTLALERGFGASPIPSTSASTLPPPAPPPSSTQPGPGGAPFGRRMSTLGSDVPMTMTWDDDGDSGHHHLHHPHPHSHRRGGTATPNGDDMMSMSPAAGDADLLPPPPSASMFRSTRSRSGSASSAMLLGANPPSSSSQQQQQQQLFPLTAIPPSPVTLARALQHGAKTPPPFLQRRLFKEDGTHHHGGGGGVDETASGSGRSSRSGSSSDVGMSGVGGKTRAMRIAAMTSALPPGDDDDEIDELSAVLSRSASAGPEDQFERVVRRPVSRKPNLLPKPKSHLRILSELRSESSGDQEIVSEATLHRLSRAGASAVPPGRTGPAPFDARAAPTSSSAPAASSTHPASFASRAAQQQHARPTPNRFPEQAGTEDEDLLSHRMGGGSSSSSNDEAGDEAIEVGSDWGGAMSVGGYGTEDDEERRSNVVWNGIRSGPGGNAVTVATPLSAGSMARSPHGDRRLLDYENPFAAPQTPSTTFAASRPGKRKMGNDDRFEPYAHQAFKRRAVSPAASLSLSPGFAAAAASHASSSASTSSRPTPPPPLPLSALGTQPVAIPSPSPSTTAAASSQHHHFFHAVSGVAQGAGAGGAGTRSAASSLSSSTGRGLSAFSMGTGTGAGEGRHRSLSGLEERERALAHKLDPDGLGRMSLEGEGGAGGEAVDEEEL